MKILLVGGGSGGHVTPLKAVADEIHAIDDGHSITVVTNREFYQTAKQIFADTPEIRIKKIFAGKWRRYHSKSAAWHVLHLPTLFKNIRDVIYLAIGSLQALIVMLAVRPDVVFCKGGFVCVPVGVAARIFRKRILIHDSDTRPGLTNRLLSRWATTIATGMPPEFYPYPPSKMVYTGIPISKRFKPVSGKEQRELKQDLGFTPDQPLLLVTGGGNGADSLNKKFASGVGELLRQGWGVVHLAGRGKAQRLLSERETMPKKLQNAWKIEEFADMVPRMLAADVVMARTSASTLQECANARKVVLGVPSPHLDDQKMNAEYFADHDAIAVADEQSETGASLVAQVLNLYNSDKAKSLSKNLGSLYAKTDAAQRIAETLTTVQPR